MKRHASILTALLLVQLAAAQSQELGAEPTVDPIELVSLRERWLKEKHDAAAASDRKYLADLEAAKARYAAAGDSDAVAAIERELKRLQPQMLTGHLPSAKTAAALRPVPSQRLPRQPVSASTREKIKTILEGKVWRVDHGGEGLRWYYFAKDGRLARKSRLTNWVWSDLEGTWRIDPFGTVIATGAGNTAQIVIAADGAPSITLNRDGILTVRPLYATELEYPGAGKE